MSKVIVQDCNESVHFFENAAYRTERHRCYIAQNNEIVATFNCFNWVKYEEENNE